MVAVLCVPVLRGGKAKKGGCRRGYGTQGEARWRLVLDGVGQQVPAELVEVVEEDGDLVHRLVGDI